MNNIYLPNGFPNTPAIKDLADQCGSGLTMTTSDKLTIKAGNGLQLSGDELVAKIGAGLSFGENGAIQVTSEGVTPLDLSLYPGLSGEITGFVIGNYVVITFHATPDNSYAGAGIISSSPDLADVYRANTYGLAHAATATYSTVWHGTLSIAHPEENITNLYVDSDLISGVDIITGTLIYKLTI